MTESLAEWFSAHVAIDKGYFKPDAQAKLERVAAVMREVEAAPEAVLAMDHRAPGSLILRDADATVLLLDGARVRVVRA